MVTTLCALRKQWAFIKITNNLLFKTLDLHNDVVSGIKLSISGKINGRNRKKTILHYIGRVRTQTLSLPINYTLSTDFNLYGSFSVKV